MAEILQIHREWLVKIANGPPAIDWGDGLAQVLDTRKFFWYTGEQVRRLLGDEELQRLVDSAQLVTFDNQTVSFYAQS